jgi:hypothetical protein
MREYAKVNLTEIIRRLADEIYYNDTKYLLDEDNIVYLQKGDQYEIVGKQSKSSKINFLEELVQKKLIAETIAKKPINLQIIFENQHQTIGPVAF